MDKRYLVLFVENNVGVLTRITSLFVQRGFNIDTVTVSSTDKEGISRITGSLYADEKMCNQLISQIEKLIEVKKVLSFNDDNSVRRELLIVKIATNSDDLDAAIRTAADNHFRIVDSYNGCMILETTGSPSKIDRKLKLLEPFKIVEMCRTGVTALEKGIVDYKF